MTGASFSGIPDPFARDIEGITRVLAAQFPEIAAQPDFSRVVKTAWHAGRWRGIEEGRLKSGREGK